MNEAIQSPRVIMGRSHWRRSTNTKNITQRAKKNTRDVVMTECFVKMRETVEKCKLAVSRVPVSNGIHGMLCDVVTAAICIRVCNCC
jgi:hypothetical protein